MKNACQVLIATSCDFAQAVIVRPLSVVSSLVRFAEEPQMFAIEFNDGCPIHVSICYFMMRLGVKKWPNFIHGSNDRCMRAHLVIACLQQFVMFCKQRYLF